MKALTKNDQRTLKLWSQGWITESEVTTPDETARKYLYCESCETWFDGYQKNEKHECDALEPDLDPDVDRTGIPEHVCNGINQYLTNHTPIETARKFNVSRATVLKHDHTYQETNCKEHGGMTSARCDVIREMKEDGIKRADIATQFDVDESTITYHVRGDCACDNEIEPVEYQRDTITADVCDSMRQDRLNGMQEKDLIDKYGFVRSAIYNHTHGKCDCKNTVPRFQVTENVDAGQCQRIRAASRIGVSRRMISQSQDIHHTAVTYHASGKCSHQVSESPVVNYDISHHQCIMIRRAYDNLSVSDVAEKFSTDIETIQTHANEKCEH